MMVFWSSDPEATSGAMAASRAPRAASGSRSSASRSSTSIPTSTTPPPSSAASGSRPSPTTSPALALAIAMSGSPRASTTRTYVAKRTTGFDEWKAYILGEDRRHRQDARMAGGGNRRAGARTCGRWPANGAPRRPISAPAAGATAIGGACRSADRHPVGARRWSAWSPCRGSAGRASISATCRFGTPLDFNFYFPGYAEGGISGDLNYTASGQQLLPAHAAPADHEPAERR